MLLARLLVSLRSDERVVELWRLLGDDTPSDTTRGAPSLSLTILLLKKHHALDFDIVQVRAIATARIGLLEVVEGSRSDRLAHHDAAWHDTCSQG